MRVWGFIDIEDHEPADEGMGALEETVSVEEEPSPRGEF